MLKLLIVGSGDIARRALSTLRTRYRVFALLRDPSRQDEWRRAGATPITGDLDQPASLHRLRDLADLILHCAPPPADGATDTRTRHLLAALGRGKSVPRHLVYVSTTGVYGDCAGATIDETRRPAATTARALRRVDAEQTLRRWGRDTGCRVNILRAPGIYAADRLPTERLQRGLPALIAADDVYSNHIHADDLAAACVAAFRRGRANRAYNVVDDSDCLMGDYFDQVADCLALPRPPRLPRAALAEQLSPIQLSFMAESRRIGNRRLKEELALTLRHPTVASGLAAAHTERTAACS